MSLDPAAVSEALGVARSLAAALDRLLAETPSRRGTLVTSLSEARLNAGLAAAHLGRAHERAKAQALFDEEKRP